MNVSKLFKAASLVRESHPELSKELKKIAIDIQNVPSDSSNEMANTQPQNSTQPDAPQVAGDSQYFSAAPQEDRTQHQFTVTLNVNKDTPKTEIANEVYKVLQQLETQKGYEITDYAFKSK